MQDGEVGDTIEVIYSGVVKAPWATAGNTFRDGAGGVFGFSPIDGVLEVMAKQALEQAFEQGIKIATGIYTGTGAYGQDNPTEIPLPIDAKIVFIKMNTGTNALAVFMKGNTQGMCLYSGNSTWQSLPIISFDSVLSFYNNSSASIQCNSQYSYSWVAIG